MERPKMRAARLRKGWRLVDLERATGILRTRLAQIERGDVEPREDEAVRIYRAIGITSEVKTQ